MTRRKYEEEPLSMDPPDLYEDEDDDPTGWGYLLRNPELKECHEMAYSMASHHSPTIDVPLKWWNDPQFKAEILNTVENTSAHYKWLDEPYPVFDRPDWVTVASHQNL